MALKDLMKWNTRVSAMYALGIWTMIGSYALLSYTGHYEIRRVKKDEEEEVQQVEDVSNQVVYQTPHSKTTIIYKKDFVPFTTRINNFFSSFSGGPGSGDGDK